MSTQSRLERLGLAHLADDEEALTRALQAMEESFRERDAHQPAPPVVQTTAPKAPQVQPKAAPVAQAKTATPAKAAPPAEDIAAIYTRLGSGARDRSGRVGGGRTTTRGSAPLVTPEQFAARVAQLGTQNELTTFLPRLQKLPEQMRILTLEALYGAQDAEEVRGIIMQTEPMLQ